MRIPIKCQVDLYCTYNNSVCMQIDADIILASCVSIFLSNLKCAQSLLRILSCYLFLVQCLCCYAFPSCSIYICTIEDPQSK